MSGNRRYLVVVRAGDDSLHERWLACGERNWDLVVSYGGDDAQIFHRPDVMRVDGKGAKWPALRELLASDVVDWRAYDYVWITQGDMITTGDDVSRMFDICSGLDLWVAHPALHRDSPTNHTITLHNPAFGLRFVNFVEATAPVFQTRFLGAVLPSLQLNDSGGGLGYLWPRLVDDAGRRCAVIDSVPMQRMRPMHGAVRFEDAPVTAERHETVQLMSAFQIAEAAEINIGALMRTGERYSLFDDTCDAFMGRILRGMVGVAAGPHALGLVYMAHERARRAGPLAVQTVAAAGVSADAGTRGASSPTPASVSVPAPASMPAAAFAPAPGPVATAAPAATAASLRMPATPQAAAGAAGGTFEPTVGLAAGPTSDDMESMAALRKLAMSVRRTSLRQPA